MNLKTTALTLTAAAILAYAPNANAANITGTDTITGFIWGGVVTQGTCPTGSHPVYSEVPDYNGAARYWVNGDTNLTWTDVLASGVLNDPNANQHWGYMFNAGTETTLAEGTTLDDTKLYEGDCVPDGTTLPEGPYKGGGTPVEAVTITKTWAPVYDVKIIPAKTHTEIVPAVTHKEPIYRTMTTSPGRWFQVDTYTPKNLGQVVTLNKLDDDHLLRYHEDKPLWGASSWKFVYLLTAEVKAANGDVVKALATRTGLPVKASENTARKYRSTTLAWCLGNGAKAVNGGGAWGPNHDIHQIAADHCAMPSPVTRQILEGYKTVIDRPATKRIVIDQPETSEKVLVTPGRTETRTVPATDLDAYLYAGWTVVQQARELKIRQSL